METRRRGHAPAVLRGAARNKSCIRTSAPSHVEDWQASGSMASKATVIKRPWKQEEDAMVIKMVSQHGPRHWSVIASKLPGHVGKQCRERWQNHFVARSLRLHN